MGKKHAVLKLWCTQRAKKVMCNSLGLLDFAIFSFFVLNLPDREVLFFGKIQITEGL